MKRGSIARVAAFTALSAIVALGPRVARADEGDERKLAPEAGTGDTSDRGDWLLRRSHTLAEAEVGMFAIPGAPISTAQRGGDLPIGTIGHGDATLATGMHLLYRFGRDWVLGAGALFAPLPTTDNEIDPVSGLPRTHARSYLWMGGEGRFIPLHLRGFEAWVGVAVGGVIVADRFTTNAGAPVPPIEGTKTVTVSAQGGSVGAQIGGDWLVSERIVLGFVTRLDYWLLPSTPQCGALRECTTLLGSPLEIEFGLRVGYRIPL